jgi:hypothetical protein
MASKRRHGRPRKNGPRHSNGHLKRARREADDSPRAIAARMPHRRALGEHALDQGAENELGRMVLRGELGASLALAGETYAAQWRAYVSTLDGPRWPWQGQGRGLPCLGCPTPEVENNCACARARRSYAASNSVLWSSVGTGAAHLVRLVVIEGLPCAASCLDILRLGLNALAQHYGLTGGQKWKKNTKEHGPNLSPVRGS